MGLFDNQRQLAAESGVATDRAEQASAGRDGLSELIAEAWSAVHDPKHVAQLFAARARDDADAALVLARVDHEDPAAHRALAAEQRTLAAPLITSRLFTADPRPAARLLRSVGDPRSVPRARELLRTTTDEPLRDDLAHVIAAWGDRAARDELALPAAFTPLVATLARHGHSGARVALVTHLRSFLNEWHKNSADEWDDAFALVTAIGEARVTDAVPLLIASLATPLVCHALHVLAALAAPRAREPARALLRELGGTDAARQWAYRLAAEHCLNALGEPQPLATARAVLADLHPVRYGYPKQHEAVELRAHALAALVDRGSDADREQVATYITSPYPELRQVAASSIIKLGREVPRLRHLDEPRCRQLLAADGPRALIAALADPHALDRHTAAKLLAASKHREARAAAAGWALTHLESTPNYPTRYLDEDDLDPTSHAALAVLARLHTDRRLRERIAATTSAWARTALFKDPPVAAPAPPAIRGLWHARVRRLDRAPFEFGREVLGLALDPSGQRLAVVGEHLAQIVDTTTGAPLVALTHELARAHDCAFAPDGSALAVAYHGGHVALFDPATGEHLRKFEGNGGLPQLVKRLAFAPDGEHLAFAGSDGGARVVRWRTGEEVWAAPPGTGSFAAIAFAEDGTCLFSHVKNSRSESNFLVRLDLATRAARTIRVRTAVWSLARASGRWFAGGDGKKIHLLGSTLRPARTGALTQTGVVRLATASDGALLAASHTGALLRWDVTTATASTLLADAGKLCALAIAADGTTYAAGSSGRVHRLTADGTPLARPPGEVHSKQVSGIVALPDGTTLTSARDFTLLRWPPEFGVAELVHRDDKPLTSLVADAATAYCGTTRHVTVVDLGTRSTRQLPLGARAEDLVLTADDLHVATSDGHVRTFTTNDLSERGTTKVGAPATALARSDSGTLLFGSDTGLLAEIDTAGQISWSRGEFGRDLIDKDPHGDPHRTVVGISAHAGKFAAAAGDGTLRVFDHGALRRTLRLLTPVGLFNNCEFTPDGRFVAVSRSDGLAVFDATTGALAVDLHISAFTGADELTILAFTGPRRALVGAENGGLFEVTLEAPAIE